MQGVAGRRFESVPQVEPACILVLRMNKHRADADRFGGAQRAQHRIAQQPRADAAAGDGQVDGQTRQQHHRNRVASHSFDDSCGSRLPLKTSRCQRVVTDDPVLLLAVEHNIGTRRAGGGRLQSVLGQPMVERNASPGETLETVTRVQRLGIAEAGHYSGRGRRKSSTTSGTSRAGRSAACAYTASSPVAVIAGRGRQDLRVTRRECAAPLARERPCHHGSTHARVDEAEAPSECSLTNISDEPLTSLPIRAEKRLGIDKRCETSEK